VYLDSAEGDQRREWSDVGGCTVDLPDRWDLIDRASIGVG